MEQQQDVTLANLAGGGVVERFNDEFQKVLENIMDPNTTLGAREISLKVKIKPDKNRDFSTVDIEVKSKMAPASPLATKMFIAFGSDGACATEYNPQQPPLPEINTTSNITPLRTVGGN